MLQRFTCQSTRGFKFHLFVNTFTMFHCMEHSCLPFDRTASFAPNTGVTLHLYQQSTQRGLASPHSHSLLLSAIFITTVLMTGGGVSFLFLINVKDSCDNFTRIPTFSSSPSQTSFCCLLFISVPSWLRG